MSLLRLSCILWALYLLGKLLQFPYQALVDEAERLHGSTSFVLACIASNVSGGLLSVSPVGSCIIGGLALLLLVFRVDTIIN